MSINDNKKDGVGELNTLFDLLQCQGSGRQAGPLSPRPEHSSHLWLVNAVKLYKGCQSLRRALNMGFGDSVKVSEMAVRLISAEVDTQKKGVTGLNSASIY